MVKQDPDGLFDLGDDFVELVVFKSSGDPVDLLDKVIRKLERFLGEIALTSAGDVLEEFVELAFEIIKEFGLGGGVGGCAECVVCGWGGRMERRFGCVCGCWGGMRGRVCGWRVGCGRDGLESVSGGGFRASGEVGGFGCEGGGGGEGGRRGAFGDTGEGGFFGVQGRAKGAEIS